MKSIETIEPKRALIPKKKRVAAYARVSMDSDRMQHSLSAQISYYSSLIQSNPKWEYAGVFADSGISGTNMTNRDAFNRLMEQCEEGKIDIVLVKSIPRFARNTVDLLNTVRRLKELGIEVRFEKEKINTLSGDGELLLTLLGSFAQEESRSISDNCKWGIQKIYERGEIRNCKIYGYRVENGKLAVKEDEAEIIRRIFQMFLSGDSCYRIAQKLKNEGVKSYAGKEFCGQTVAQIIRQEKYTGCTLSQKFFTADPITHKEVKNNGELPMYFAEETHPLIISKETFQLAQEAFAMRYGVEIVNGIAGKASYFYHREGSGPHPKHRAPQWSEEQRKTHAEYFRSRETAVCRYDFSHFIECENCHGHLQAQLRHYVDGSSEVAWVCNEHRQRAKDTPKPPVFRDGALKVQIASALGWEEFHSDPMFEILTGISAKADRITLHFKNGETKAFQYIPPKIIHRKRKESE